MGDISEWVTEKEIVIDDNDVIISGCYQSATYLFAK